MQRLRLAFVAWGAVCSSFVTATPRTALAQPPRAPATAEPSPSDTGAPARPGPEEAPAAPATGPAEEQSGEPSPSAPPPESTEPSPAEAEPPPKTPKTRSARPPEEEETVETVTPAHDTLRGHLLLGVGAAAIFPWGNIDGSTAQSELLGPGWLIDADAAYGVSRTVALGIYLEYGFPDSRGAASDSTAHTFALGAMVQYHLVQGLRFDPWLSAGAGFRSTGVGDSTLTGIDWTRLQIGGDWYATSNFGFGPVVELALGTNFSSSGGDLGTGSVYLNFQVGGRLAFDLPGK